MENKSDNGNAINNIIADNGNAINNIIVDNRCSKCNKKINVTNRFTCKCDKYYCSAHRYPEEHACDKMDEYKKESVQRLKEQLVKVSGNKIIPI